MRFNNQNEYTKNDNRPLTNTIEFIGKWLFVILTILLIVPAMAHADFLLQMKDGKSFTWPNFTLENNNYCTWNNGGEFCVPLSEVVSIKEITGGSAPEYATKNSPRNQGTFQPAENSASKGRIVKDIGGDGFDMRGSSTGRGRNYGQSDAYGNINRSNTSIEKELTEEEISQFEREKWLKQKDEEARQLQIERDRQTELDRQRLEADRRQRDMEEQRQRRQVEDFNRRHGF